MSIELDVLKEVIDSMVDTVKKQLEGNIKPSMSKYEAISTLGTISALVINLYDKTEDESLRVEIWALKEESDNTLQKLMELSNYD